ncbi:polyprenol phosphomannose-dependent alpha 1,6 mannosyltransferase MptB [Subtercola endophyticus]|uniref:polyprenol phosphomannose-dependent alpha 1,6 mannosyltransferase MptB n=1 Tax=Subtercola endophyticus TaxID=2895559 RepID=UPI001E2DBA1A|nr:polyprenol phosphomannose-dependent alpha 1,6 mannosyltransferase MptB [Subtercola endophyticus]UFS58222.1 polyprenol phosphomannose-dependent alpha 1,6 mannosyltransferase MptB [Subtercola endophyticus]
MKSILRRELGSPLILGLVASLFIALGSLGVGWIGPGSNVLSWPVISTLRSSDVAGYILSIVVIAASILLIIAWLKLGVQLRNEPAEGLRRVITASVAWAVPLACSVPLYTRDMFAYVAQGRLMLAGFNPYNDAVSALPGWFNIGVDPMWANAKTPYGPLFLWIEQMIMGAVNTSPITAIALFRLIAVASVVATAFFAYRIARLRGVEPAKVLWLVAASPLIMFNFVVGGHNDALMLGLLVAGIYYALKKHPIVATLLVTAAIGVKPIALLALPVVGIIWAGQNRTLRSTIKYWLASFVLSAAVLGVLGWITNVGFGWVFTLATPGSVQHWYAPVSIVTGAFGGTLDALGLDSTMTVEVIKLMALGLMVVFVAWIMFTMRKIDPLMRLALAFAAAVLSSTVIHPWYAAWVIVLFALVGLKEGIQTHLVVAGSIFFASLSIAETMDIPDAVQGDVVSQIIRNAIISAGAVALIFAYCLHEDLSLPRFLRRLRGLWQQRADARAALRAQSAPAFTGVTRGSADRRETAEVRGVRDPASEPSTTETPRPPRRG